MKLFEFKNRRERDKFPDAYVTCGFKYEAISNGLPNTTESGEFIPERRNGFVLKVVSPFTREQEYISPINYLTYRGRGRVHYIFMWRRLRQTGPIKFFRVTSFVPLVDTGSSGYDIRHG